MNSPTARQRELEHDQPASRSAVPPQVLQRLPDHVPLHLAKVRAVRERDAVPNHLIRRDAAHRGESGPAQGLAQ